MWSRLGTLIALAFTASCTGDHLAAGDVAANECRINGGVPHGSSPEDLVCLASAAAGSQRFGTELLDTDQSPLCAEPKSGPLGCVVAAAAITIDGRLRATGSRPLILVADAITVTAGGVIDVAAHSGDPDQPPGADPASCPGGVQPSVGGSSVTCGAGGSFGGTGGNNPENPQGSHCPAALPEVPTTLHGGCPGRAGGSYGALGGAGGYGGGAALLIAGSLTLDGKINASGAGGRGAAAAMFHGGNEGGGGGSGGMIAFDVLAFAGTGVVMANGGGGGAGEGQFQLPSPDGSDPDEAAPLVPAPGAPGVIPQGFQAPVAAGGAGAAGSVRDGADGDPRLPGTSAQPDFSAGGGGGGGGVIRFYAAQFTIGTVSPSPLRGS